MLLMTQNAQWVEVCGKYPLREIPQTAKCLHEKQAMFSIIQQHEKKKKGIVAFSD